VDPIKLTINDQEVNAFTGMTILEAARQVDIYIPTLCHHPDLPPAEGGVAVPVIYQGDVKIENAQPDEIGKGCGLCVVEIEGQSDLVGSCATEAVDGMVVVTENERIQSRRRENLLPVMARHRHACLTCTQQEGCPRTQCSSNVPENERCCPQFGHCELQDVANYIGISDQTPKWVPTDYPVLTGSPLLDRDYNLCIGCTRCVRACRDLRGIEAIGFIYDQNGQIQTGYIAPNPADAGCKFCTACVEVCPTGALVDKAVRPGKKEEDLVPCRAACPARIDIPAYLRLVAQGKDDEATAVIREKVPFPGILGRVCFHPCEDACRRGEIDAPVSICTLKRSAADGDQGLWKENSQVKPDSDKRVAVVGSGPVGLTAAFYLRKQGHQVTLFEALDKPGGMMRYGIPAYRLPVELLDKEINEVIDLGIDLRLNQRLGEDFTLEGLTGDGFDAVFLGVGAQLSRRIPLEGADLPDVLWGVDFLREVAQGKEVELKERVLVIGGGNVAVDVALTAKRIGAEDVLMASLESRDEMPASEWELERAQAEGIQLLSSCGPDKLICEGGLVTGMDVMECSNVFDENGNFCPQFNEGNKECIRVDQVILAVGQVSDLSFLKTDSAIGVENGLIVVDKNTLETGMPAVYAGGDVTRVPGAIIHAVAAGRQAAAAIDKALGGEGDIDEILFERPAPEHHFGRDEGFALWAREKVPERDPNERSTHFKEVSLGYNDDQAAKEAHRCLQCDLRLSMGCNPSPPARWLTFTMENIAQVPDTEGVFQLLDDEHNVLVIKGTASLKIDLMAAFEENEKTALFEFEEDKMYSQRESELIQRYLQEHGEMPGGGDDDLDDLF